MLSLKSHIETKLERARSAIEDSIRSNQTCCHLKDIDFSGGHIPKYDEEDIQNLYLLRYYGAYLCEYKWIYNKAIKYLENSNLNILSLGCGCGLDYSGLYFAALDMKIDMAKIKYVGYDVVNWLNRDHFENLSAKFIIKSVSDLPVVKRFNNIIIFPKSISDIDDLSFQKLANQLSQCDFVSPKIVLISSIRADKHYMSSDIDRFQLIFKQFSDKGFATTDKTNEYWHFSNPDKAWATLMPGFSIPDSIVEFLKHLSEKCSKYIKNKKNCKPDCAKILNRWPILKVGTSRYQMVQLQK